ncbi:transcription termination factor NusA [bacterium]|nr:transcription termination factor NusA [bacterium]
MNGEFIEALEQIQKAKGIPMASLKATIEAAMQSAYRKHYGVSEEVRLEIDEQRGTVRMFARKPILPEGVTELEEDSAPVASGAVVEGQLVAGIPEVETQYEEHEIDANDFGRIAAQTAKQVIMQRIREAEREIVYDEFSHRVGEAVTAEVQRRDRNNVIVQLGRVEALLPAHEQIPGEPYRFNDRVKIYILDVRKTTKNPQIIVSRTHPGLVLRLFELEVPEVYDGIVQIKSVAREPGARSKVAVLSRDPQIDPVGACVGHRGARVQAIVDELRGEKIDIVRYNDTVEEYLRSALSPAKVSQVLVNEPERSAVVIAPDNQLSLAIGRRGQNVRLAAQLTGWRIDIRSETQWAEAPIEIPVTAKPAAAAVGAPAQAEEVLIQGDRIRIYELARQLGVESKDLVEILQEEGVEVTSHASSITAQQAKTVRDLLLGGEGTLEELEAGAILIAAKPEDEASEDAVPSGDDASTK